jgi:hypothetical protein
MEGGLQDVVGDTVVQLGARAAVGLGRVVVVPSHGHPVVVHSVVVDDHPLLTAAPPKGLL